jgi:hypothetical protein
MILDATLTWGRISAITTYLMWREEHPWNFSVRQRVHLSNLVKYYLVLGGSNISPAALHGQTH